MKMVILDGYTLNPGDLNWGDIQKMGDLTVYDRTPADQVCQRIRGAEIVFTNKTVLNRVAFESSPSLRYVGVLATGYNVVDVDTAREKGVVVTNIPTYGTTAVAQYVFALLLEMCHHVWIHSEAVKRGEWSACPDFCFWKTPLVELSGKTMGIIGYGRIGRATAAIAQALGMKVLAYDNHMDELLNSADFRFVPLNTLLTESDVISLHCPLFDSTRGIINRQNISRMKDGVMIVNTSRGPLIVEQDLADALNSGKVAYAAVDVLSVEPPRPDNPLIAAKNCLITPHIAWAPKESRARLMAIAVDNLRQFLQGHPVNQVNR